MKTLRFTETQIVNILKLTYSGMRMDDICRQNEIYNSGRTCRSLESLLPMAYRKQQENSNGSLSQHIR